MHEAGIKYLPTSNFRMFLPNPSHPLRYLCIQMMMNMPTGKRHKFVLHTQIGILVTITGQIVQKTNINIQIMNVTIYHFVIGIGSDIAFRA